MNETAPPAGNNTIPLETLPSPSLLRRLAAMFYDAWLVFALMIACSAIMVGLRVLIQGADAIPHGQVAISGAWRIPTFLLMIFALFHFFAYFWIKNGQTLGMQSWRIRLDNEQHQHVSLKQAYIRLLAACLSLFCCGIGYLWMYIDKDRLTWHDRLSKTHLVLLPKNKK